MYYEASVSSGFSDVRVTTREVFKKFDLGDMVSIDFVELVFSAIYDSS